MHSIRYSVTIQNGISVSCHTSFIVSKIILKFKKFAIVNKLKQHVFTESHISTLIAVFMGVGSHLID